jgi:hypothetical protein
MSRVRQKQVRGEAVWQATRAWLQRTNLWRERTNLRTGSERLTGVIRRLDPEALAYFGPGIWSSKLLISNWQFTMKKLLLASVLAIASFPGHAVEQFDWGKYCGSKNEYCDPSDDEDNKWESPSHSLLNNCTKNGKLDYACIRKTEDQLEVCTERYLPDIKSEPQHQAGYERCMKQGRAPARVTVAPPYQGPPPIGWVYEPYTICGWPFDGCFVNVQADGLNVRTTPDGYPVMSLVNGTPLIPLQKQGDWLLVAPACDLTPTWAWSWNAGVPLNRCWVYF